MTGLRASLKRAIDVKRNSDVIVDSIASEDLGKFPDSNVAESLQRITGVSIDRDDGEGRFVTVRGFGPQYNTVLVNGRDVATENPGREFSFDLLSADLIGGADVYKTTNAAIQEGGIGATINLKTLRPLDINGQRFVLSAKADYESQSGKTTPDIFALYSNTFMDGKIGILGSVTYQQRKARVDSDLDDGYITTSVGSAAAGNLINNVNVPEDYVQAENTETRTRTAYTGTIQYRPISNLLFTVDGIYNDFNVKSVENEISHFFVPGGMSNVTLDSNRNVTSFNQDDTGHTDYVSTSTNRPTTLRSLGFNAKYDPIDRLTLSFDSSYSQAKDNNGGNADYAVIGFNEPLSYSALGPGLPSITAANGFTNPDVGMAHYASEQGSNVVDTIYEQKFDGVYKTDFENFTAVRFGAIYENHTKTNQLVESNPTVACLYCGYSIPVPAGILQPFSPSNFLSGIAGNFPRQWLAFNPNSLFAFLSSQAAANAQDAAVGNPIGTSYATLLADGGFTPQVQPSSYQVHENIYGGYLETDFKGTVFGLPWGAVAGVRIVHTDEKSTGTEQNLASLTTNPADPTAYSYVLNTTGTQISGKSSYNDVLPTLNLRLNATRDMVVRFAVSQTVTRPNVTDLAPQVTYTELRPGNLEATSGNPALTPMKSTNLDLSYEWYYQKAGYFTVAAYYKDLSDFIVDAVGAETFALTPTPAFPTGSATFQVTAPRNVASAEVHGLEVGFQHTFDYLPAPFNGLGITANATFIASSSSGSGSESSSALALPGLGNSQNIIGFYAGGPFEIRVAYNHRDGFLSTQANPVGGEPIYTKTAGQVDFQARYNVTPHLSFVVEGINLNNALTQTYGQYQSQVLSVVETGPRYAVGARMQF